MNKEKAFSEETRKRMRESHLGNKHSEETKRKIGKGNMNKILSKETKEKMSKARLGKSSWNKGIPHPEETRRKISKTLKGCYGSRNSNWKGGLTNLIIGIRNSLRYRQWRDDIFTHDNFTCQSCGDDRGHNLNAHHIESSSKILQQYEIATVEESLGCDKLWSLNNGITLCEDCHKLEHRKKVKNE